MIIIGRPIRFVFSPREGQKAFYILPIAGKQAPRVRWSPDADSETAARRCFRLFSQHIPKQLRGHNRFLNQTGFQGKLGKGFPFGFGLRLGRGKHG